MGFLLSVHSLLLWEISQETLIKQQGFKQHLDWPGLTQRRRSPMQAGNKLTHITDLLRHAQAKPRSS